MNCVEGALKQGWNVESISQGSENRRGCVVGSNGYNWGGPSTGLRGSGQLLDSIEINASRCDQHSKQGCVALVSCWIQFYRRDQCF